MKNQTPILLFVVSEKAPNGNFYTSSLRSAMHLSTELESRPKSSRSRLDFDTTRPRLGARSQEETETRRKTFEITGSQKVVNILILKMYDILTNFYIRENVASHSSCLIQTQKKLLL